jgi:hypothetical protein
MERCLLPVLSIVEFLIGLKIEKRKKMKANSFLEMEPLFEQ